MSGPVAGLGPRSQNVTPQPPPLEPNQTAQAFQQAQPQEPPGRHHAPANKFAPIGWRQRVSVEFDLQVPSGQWCHVRRLDRVDLFKLGIVDHLDTLLPKLIELGEGEDRAQKINDAVMQNISMVDQMYNVMDIVVMACCIKPILVQDKKDVNYGTAEDWENPDFVARVHVDDVSVEDKQFIFANVFGGDVDAFKSPSESPSVVGTIPTVAGLPLPTQSNS